MKIINVNTHARNEFVDITREIEKIVTSLGLSEGACLVYVPHTTAGVMINENADPDVMHDIDDFLRRMVPKSSNFAHMEGNSDAHINGSVPPLNLSVYCLIPILFGLIAASDNRQLT